MTAEGPTEDVITRTLDVPPGTPFYDDLQKLIVYVDIEECGVGAPRAVPVECELAKGHEGHHWANLTWEQR